MTDDDVCEDTLFEDWPAHEEDDFVTEDNEVLDEEELEPLDRDCEDHVECDELDSDVGDSDESLDEEFDDLLLELLDDRDELDSSPEDDDPLE